ncbi:MAG: hypothetical protein WAL04_18870 [Acidimicrobiales bacterium]
MSRYVAALVTAIGDDVTTKVHPVLLGQVLGDAAPRDVLVSVSSRATAELKHEQQRGEAAP